MIHMILPISLHVTPLLFPQTPPTSCVTSAASFHVICLFFLGDSAHFFPHGSTYFSALLRVTPTVTLEQKTQKWSVS